MSSIELDVQDMTCGSCVKHVTEALQSVPGVAAVEVELASGRVRVSGTPDSAALLAALDEAGYGAQLADTPAAAKTGGCCGGCGSH
ncbi:MAG TPA: cation transporter [Pseudomonas sp.]|nr:cation transporter [Pseudomonas sp.]